MAQSPVTAPHGSETFVKVIPTMHSLADECAPPGHLKRTSRGAKAAEYLEHPVAYDPEGVSCFILTLNVYHLEWLGCVAPFFTFIPIVSVACSPKTLYMSTSVLSHAVTSSVWWTRSTGLSGSPSTLRPRLQYLSATFR